MSNQSATLENQFLIAMPQMLDPNFSGTLTYICKHDQFGAMGIVINRPSKLSLKSLLEQMDLPLKGKDHAIYAGGPVQLERGFVLHTGEQEWQSRTAISETIRLTTSKDILAAIADNHGPDHYLIALGYAGWGAGQLEQELAENVWLCCTANEEVMFNTPDADKLNKAIALLGIDTNQLNSQVGHA